jgi:hypothetical protein
MTPLLRALLPPGILGPRAGRFVSFQPFLVDGAAYGGLVGSVEDAGRFLASHLDQRRGILSSTSREAMQRIAASKSHSAGTAADGHSRASDTSSTSAGAPASGT